MFLLQSFRSNFYLDMVGYDLAWQVNNRCRKVGQSCCFKLFRFTQIGSLAQLVEQRTLNP